MAFNEIVLSYKFERDEVKAYMKRYLSLIHTLIYESSTKSRGKNRSLILTNVIRSMHDEKFAGFFDERLLEIAKFYYDYVSQNITKKIRNFINHFFSTGN